MQFLNFRYLFFKSRIPSNSHPTPVSVSHLILSFTTLNTPSLHAKLLQVCLTVFDPMDYNLPGSSVHGFSSKKTGVDCHALLWGVILALGSNPPLLQPLHCRRILYWWATREAHTKLSRLKITVGNSVVSVNLFLCSVFSLGFLSCCFICSPVFMMSVRHEYQENVDQI